MKRSNGFQSSKSILLTLVLLFLAVTLLSSGSDTPALTQNTKSQGGITGTVSANQGVVRGFQVKARDTVNRITYTAFTRSGRYRIPDLPPSTYEIRVTQKGFDSPVQQIKL